MWVITVSQTSETNIMGASFSTSLAFTPLARDLFGAYSVSESKFTPLYSVAQKKLAQMATIFAASDSVSVKIQEDENKRIKIRVNVASVDNDDDKSSSSTSSPCIRIPDAETVDRVTTFYRNLQMIQNIRDKIDAAFHEVEHVYTKRRRRRRQEGQEGERQEQLETEKSSGEEEDRVIERVKQGRVPAYFEYKSMIKAVSCELWKTFIHEYANGVLSPFTRDDDDGKQQEFSGINRAAESILATCKRSLDDHEESIREVIRHKRI